MWTTICLTDVDVLKDQQDTFEEGTLCLFNHLLVPSGGGLEGDRCAKGACENPQGAAGSSRTSS